VTASGPLFPIGAKARCVAMPLVSPGTVLRIERCKVVVL
jgi:hypothetical protein